MTTNADFSPEEWKVVLEGPPSAGMLVVTAAHGGMWRESIAMSKAYAEARAQHGGSELVDEIVSSKPKMDHTRYRTPEELKEHSLTHLREAVALLDEKATPEELDGYRQFILHLANMVAAAHKEGGVEVSPPEAAAIDEITAALGVAKSRGSSLPALQGAVVGVDSATAFRRSRVCSMPARLWVVRSSTPVNHPPTVPTMRPRWSVHVSATRQPLSFGSNV